MPRSAAVDERPALSPATHRRCPAGRLAKACAGDALRARDRLELSRHLVERVPQRLASDGGRERRVDLGARRWLGVGHVVDAGRRPDAAATAAAASSSQTVALYAERLRGSGEMPARAASMSARVRSLSGPMNSPNRSTTVSPANRCIAFVSATKAVSVGPAACTGASSSSQPSPPSAYRNATDSWIRRSARRRPGRRGRRRPTPRAAADRSRPTPPGSPLHLQWGCA